MVNTLVLVRHGNPEDEAQSGLDQDRRLTDAGLRALKATYPTTFALVGEETAPEVWSSPAIRALQTANVVADALGVEDVAVRQSLYEQDVPAVLAELGQTDASTVVLVGHVPFMNILAAQLTGESLTFNKGAAMAIDLPEGPLASGSVAWYVAGPKPLEWGAVAIIEAAVADATAELPALLADFRKSPESVQALSDLRTGVRTVRALLAFCEPWLSKKQVKRCKATLAKLIFATDDLRSLDTLSAATDDLVDAGELGENSLLPVACAKERALVAEGTCEQIRHEHLAKRTAKLARDLTKLSWKGGIQKAGLSTADAQARFDELFAESDEELFGLDLHDYNAVHHARRNARSLELVAVRMREVLGTERADCAEYLKSLQAELAALVDGCRTERIAKGCSKEPHFRGVRADLGVVARDQREAVSAILSGLQRMEVAEAEGPEPELDPEPEFDLTPDPEPAPAPEQDAGADDPDADPVDPDAAKHNGILALVRVAANLSSKE